MSVPKYPYVLFDMDGTLIDSIPVVMESFQRAVHQVYGHRETNALVLKNSIGLPLKESFAHYPEKDQPALQNAYIKINDDLQKDGVPLFPGILEMLRKMQQNGIRLAVVTSKRLDATLRLIQVMKLDDLFETVVGKESTQRHKPFGDPILKCMEIMHVVNKSEVLYVGDSIHDLECAADAGVDSAAVDWTQMDKGPLHTLNPTHWLYRPEELVSISTGNTGEAE